MWRGLDKGPHFLACLQANYANEDGLMCEHEYDGNVSSGVRTVKGKVAWKLGLLAT